MPVEKGLAENPPALWFAARQGQGLSLPADAMGVDRCGPGRRVGQGTALRTMW